MKLFEQRAEREGLVMVMSERIDGSMIIPRGEETDAGTIKHNRTNFLLQYNIQPEQVVSARLSHGNQVAPVTAAEAGKMVPEADALMTDEAGLYLSVTGADCPPIFFFDPVHHAIGLAHAGRRGLAAGIVTEVISAMVRAFGTKPADLRIGIGPGICGRHYDVPAEVAAGYQNCPAALQGKIRPDHRPYFLNLAVVATLQSEQAGVPSRQVEIMPVCTWEDRRFWSARRDASDPVEAGMAVFGIRRT